MLGFIVITEFDLNHLSLHSQSYKENCYHHNENVTLHSSIVQYNNAHKKRSYRLSTKLINIPWTDINSNSNNTAKDGGGWTSD